MAHLCLGDALITVLPVQDSPFDQYLKQPDEIGGSETQTSYIVLRDVQAHYHRAKAAGAEIILELTRDDQGGRGYSCRDCEGHIWSFGTYDPRQENPNTLKWFGPTTTRDQKRDRTRVARTAVPVTLVVGLIAGWVLGQYGVHNVVELVQTTSVVSRETPEHSPATPIVAEAPSSATLDVSSADPRSSYLAELAHGELRHTVSVHDVGASSSLLVSPARARSFQCIASDNARQITVGATGFDST